MNGICLDPECFTGYIRKVEKIHAERGGSMLRANGPVRGTECYDNLAVQGYGFVPLLHQKSTLRATQLTDVFAIYVPQHFWYYTKKKCTFYLKRLFKKYDVNIKQI